MIITEGGGDSVFPPCYFTPAPFPVMFNWPYSCQKTFQGGEYSPTFKSWKPLYVVLSYKSQQNKQKKPLYSDAQNVKIVPLGLVFEKSSYHSWELNDAIHLKYTIQSNQISRGTFSIILVANLSILPKFSWAQFATHLNIFNVKNVIIGGDVREDLIKRAWKWGKPPPGTSWRAKNHSFNDFSFSLKIYWVKSISTYWLQKVCCSYKNHLIPYV